jgi:hypothetical protein
MFYLEIFVSVIRKMMHVCVSALLLIHTVKDFGPSGVRALPLAAGINVGGHYKGHFFLFLSCLFLSSGSSLILPEGIVVGFCNFAWAPK